MYAAIRLMYVCQIKDLMVVMFDEQLNRCSRFAFELVVAYIFCVLMKDGFC